MKVIKKKALDLSLFVISVTAIVLAVKSGGDFKGYFSKFSTLNELIFNLSCGWLSSYFFYILIVRIPEIHKNGIMKRNVMQYYEEFRQECILIFVLIADGSCPSELPKELLDKKKFREFFKG